MSLVVYALCALTSLACAILLFRGYRRTRTRLLLWSALCFVCMSVGNAMVIVDFRIVPERDLTFERLVPTLVGVALLIYGMVWDSE